MQETITIVTSYSGQQQWVPEFGPDFAARRNSVAISITFPLKPPAPSNGLAAVAKPLRICATNRSSSTAFIIVDIVVLTWQLKFRQKSTVLVACSVDEVCC
jgi:hypothetical protein